MNEQKTLIAKIDRTQIRILYFGCSALEDICKRARHKAFKANDTEGYRNARAIQNELGCVRGLLRWIMENTEEGKAYEIEIH